MRLGRLQPFRAEFQNYGLDSVTFGPPGSDFVALSLIMPLFLNFSWWVPSVCFISHNIAQQSLLIVAGQELSISTHFASPLAHRTFSKSQNRWPAYPITLFADLCFLVKSHRKAMALAQTRHFAPASAQWRLVRTKATDRPIFGWFFSRLNWTAQIRRLITDLIF